MKFIDKKGISVGKFDNLSKQAGLIHFNTTRKGGDSNEPFHKLNLALHVSDVVENVIKNRQTLANSLEIDAEQFVFANQTHSSNIVCVDKYDAGKGLYSLKNAIANTDALITNQSGVCLMIMVADCAPIFLFDPITKTAAVVHAGWRGTVDQIVAKTAQKMIAEFGCTAQNILVAIGPSISTQNYEVKNDVVDAVYQSIGNTFGYIKHENRKTYFSLWAANFLQLSKIGIPDKNIEIAKICTFQHPEIFFSARFSQGITGRFAAGIMMK